MFIQIALGFTIYLHNELHLLSYLILINIYVITHACMVVTYRSTGNVQTAWTSLVPRFSPPHPDEPGKRLAFKMCMSTLPNFIVYSAFLTWYSLYRL